MIIIIKKSRLLLQTTGIIQKNHSPFYAVICAGLQQAISPFALPATEHS